MAAVGDRKAADQDLKRIDTFLLHLLRHLQYESDFIIVILSSGMHILQTVFYFFPPAS